MNTVCCLTLDKIFDSNLGVKVLTLLIQNVIKYTICIFYQWYNYHIQFDNAMDEIQQHIRFIKKTKKGNNFILVIIFIHGLILESWYSKQKHTLTIIIVTIAEVKFDTTFFFCKTLYMYHLVCLLSICKNCTNRQGKIRHSLVNVFYMLNTIAIYSEIKIQQY